MFTGLIEAVGHLVERATVPGGFRLRIAAPVAGDVALGDSVAVNGVCLTVVATDRDAMAFGVGPETARVTTLGALTTGCLVNLERPLRADGRFGGHFVQGHVDATGTISRLVPDGDSYWMDVDIPAAFESFVIPKGSIAIDGVSLTIATLSARRVGIQLVPFTWTHTAFHALRPGDAVNLEADVIGKYVERLLAGKDRKS